jgi:arylformamidase
MNGPAEEGAPPISAPVPVSSRLVDLTHTIRSGMPIYPGLPEPLVEDHMPFDASRPHYDPGVEFRIGRMELVGNTGTYLDAPGHRIREGADIGGLALSSVADLPGVVVRVPWEEGRGVDRERIEDALEAMASRGAPGTARPLGGMAVLLHTGWDSRWGTPRYFQDHPFLTRGAAEALREGGAVLLGMDTLNVDDTTDGARPAHTILLGAGIPIVENLTGLEQLPDRGFFFSAVPAKVTGMTSFPVRAWGRLG